MTPTQEFPRHEHDQLIHLLRGTTRLHRLPNVDPLAAIFPSCSAFYRRYAAQIDNNLPGTQPKYISSEPGHEICTSYIELA